MGVSCNPVLWLCVLRAAAETQDAEEAQACLLVTLVVLSKGRVSLPEQPLRDTGAFKESMKSVRGRWAGCCAGRGVCCQSWGRLLLVLFTCNLLRPGRPPCKW